jgi:hypothetical protein
LAELAYEDGMGRLLLQDQVSKELTMFGIYKDASGRKRWGEIPVSSQAEL